MHELVFKQILRADMYVTHDSTKGACTVYITTSLQTMGRCFTCRVSNLTGINQSSQFLKIEIVVVMFRREHEMCKVFFTTTLCKVILKDVQRHVHEHECIFKVIPLML
jgi:hypothetical protein